MQDIDIHSSTDSDRVPSEASRTANGRFAKGNPGGPGRPPKASMATVAALDELGVEAARELMGVVMEQARAGNLKAIEMVLARIWPARRGRPVQIDARPVRACADLMSAHGAVVDAVLAGDVSAAEGAQVSAVLETQRRIVSDVELERLIAELEERIAEGRERRVR